MSTEEEPKRAGHAGWVITQDERPALDGQGRYQIFGSPGQAKSVAKRQGRDIRHCTINIQPGEEQHRGTPEGNLTRTLIARSAAREQNRIPTQPRAKKTPDPARARERVRAAIRRDLGR